MAVNSNIPKKNGSSKSKWDNDYLANKQKHRDSKRELADRMAEMIKKKMGDGASPQTP